MAFHPISVSQPKAHLIAMPIPAWGHVRPLCAFLARVLHLHSVYITFLIAGDNVSRVQMEFSQYFSSRAVAKEKSKFVRVIGLGSLVPSVQDHIFSMGNIARTYQQMYMDMLNCRPVTCAWTGIIHPAFNIKPNLVIADICSHFAVSVTHSITGNTVPILVWVATPASSLIRLFGDESRGGIGDLALKIEERAQLYGNQQRREDCAAEVYRECSNMVIRIPGLPPHYDHEWHPQEPRSPSRIPWVVHKGYSSLNLSCGALSLSCESYEPESTRAVHEWFYEEGKEYFAVGVGTTGDWRIGGNGVSGFMDESNEGHLSTKSVGGNMLKSTAAVSLSTMGSDLKIPTNEEKVRRLLDLALEKQGPHSLIYIAFGSVFWPKESTHVWELVHTLLDLDIPFIFSHASLNGSTIPNDLSRRLSDSQTGLMLEWVQQGVILEHQATGWFITHCGANSVLEALYQGVPLICWPQEGDQPANALYVSNILDCGFELVQVRTGLGRRKMYRQIHYHQHHSYESTSLSSSTSSLSPSPITRSPSSSSSSTFSVPSLLTIPFPHPRLESPSTPSELLSPISPLFLDDHDHQDHDEHDDVNNIDTNPPPASTKSVRAEFMDILARARGPSGQIKRENAMKMGERLRSAWMDDGNGGVSYNTARRFVKRFVSFEKE
ncbi:hypothetical protein Clacol_003340 [Clathrus columnatus]|uniref:UDP-Glycosyltransferase/glycogen phosphorylase n=1 Tax=Clathrus columnatus TaxID=1419009 RepID=A0AAV5A903_9AGAM|nr:hypothetical protein Clacol_003340 [Clathrus columnatus]